MNLPTLDNAVASALEFFQQNPPPDLDISDFEFPFVVGSGNAYNTGQIIFSSKAAVYADESNFRQLIKAYGKAIDQKLITQAVIISASGGKDSSWEIELAKEKGLKTLLLTTKKDSPAAKLADEVKLYKSLPEPYTYNTSTYMGMILSSTKENISEIEKYIKELKFPDNFEKYNSYAFVLPDQFLSICPMLDIKKSELFGPLLSLRAFTQGHARHAKFVIRSEEELVISVNFVNQHFGTEKNRWNINTPDNFSFASMMALTYFIVGKIQASKPPFFEQNVKNYVNDYGPKAYGKNDPFDLIVPGSSD
jgi:hypothetical protein